MFRATLIGLKLAACIAVSAAQAQDAEFGVLVEAEGVEETYIYCSACHSERLVAQQGLTREKWIAMLEWMVEEQGMPEIEEPDYSRVIDYLAEHYNTDRPNFPYE